MVLFSKLRLISHRLVKYVKYSTKKNFKQMEIEKIRNIGILAHIDAGKTTTTERMLFYSGLINTIGEVHHGNTVTDFMDQERERGITIKSAAVTFYWNKYQMNLIDTPGHIDFTMEVEQTLNIIDGVIVIVDASAGVEAQTLTVWRQAERYGIPRIIFINKMDRPDANYEMSCKSIQSKLNIPVMCLHLPLKTNNVFSGVIDIIAMEKIYFIKEGVNVLKLSEKDDFETWENANKARTKLIDALTEYDDILADLVLSLESFDLVSTVDVVKSLKRVTLRQQAVPVLLGSAYKNIGVQLLMDSVITYLPSPNELYNLNKISQTSLFARIFKIRYDKYKGSLTFLRLYNGNLSKGQKICYINRERSENCGKLYVSYADEFQEVDTVENGNIAVVSGLKLAQCGDWVANSQTSGQKIANEISKLASDNKLTLGSSNLQNRFVLEPHVPEPVFFCSIEPQSEAYQNSLDQALSELQREDPSFRTSYDESNGQTVLSGMGELHLEIIKNRILSEYKLDVSLGPLEIVYLEAPICNVTDSASVDTKIAGNRQFINIKLSLLPHEGPLSGEILKFDKRSEEASNIASIHPKRMVAIRQGIEIGLLHGPKVSSRVVNCEVMLHFFESSRGTSESMVSATVTQLLRKMITKSGTNLLEPIMSLEIASPEEYMSSIMGDLGKRRAEIRNIEFKNNIKLISANVPLSQLLGYSTALRTISSGTASFFMEFNEYRNMSAHDEDVALINIRGF